MLSMTGYGRGRAAGDGRELLLEIRAVNHRFLDLSFRLPKTLPFLEETLRAMLGDGRMLRGHVEITVNYRNVREDANAVEIDRPLLIQCAREAKAAAEVLGQPPPSVGEMITLSGALRVTQADEDADAVTALAVAAYREAFAQLQAMRLREGEAMAADLAANLAGAEALAARIAALAPAVPAACRERLEARLAEWNVPAAEPQRVAQEIAILADKCSVDEELARLNSHFGQFRQCLTASGEAGRRMDFLLQEMNRETNTVGSKAADAQIAQCVVELKCLLEKLREQVQNIV
jgi:uncharacterized protein (TIGR00255 family)